MEDIRIISPGLMTTIQDYGRDGYREYGVPASGAVDKLSMKFANMLVGNVGDEAVLEMTITGSDIMFQINTAIAITGADLSPRINGNIVEMYKTIYISKGDILEFTASIRGARAYVAFWGGIQIASVMGSKSTYIRGGFGGLEGRKLTSGDVLSLNLKETFKYFGIRKIPEHLIPQFENEATIRVVLGPDKETFTDEGIEVFLNSKFTLTNQWDRMGCRLEGPKIAHKNSPDIISSGLIPGTIQVPGHGNPIVMMSDAQTTGGYARIANVISVDMPYMAQLKPGDRVKFCRIELDEAHRLIREQEGKLVNLMENFNTPSRKLLGGIKYYSVRTAKNSYSIMVQELESDFDE
jgi:biotin-dependent carboxylase-like uncharacterized protein